MIEFSGESGKLLKYIGDEKTVRIPDKYSVIGYHAFYETDPEIIIVPETVTEIDMNGIDFGFGHGDNLKEIHICGEDVEVNNWSFPYTHKYKLYVKGKVFSKLSAILKDMIVWTYLDDDTITTEEKVLIKYINNKSNFENLLEEIIRKDKTDALRRLISRKRIKTEDYDKYIAWATDNNAINCKLVLAENAGKSSSIIKTDHLQKGKTIADYKKEFKLSKSGDTYVISSYKGTAPTVIVPGEILGNTVVGIADDAFAFSQNGISSEAASFRKEQLEEVIIEEGIETIGRFAFSGCKKLKRVVLPKSVKTIEKGAFYDCPSLSDISIENDINLEERCFSKCPNLKKDPSGFVIINSQLFGYYGNDETVRIPEGVKRIDNTIFSFNKNIKHIILPSSLERIDAYAFSNCESLQSIRIPISINKIESGVFSSCQNLKEVEIGENVQTIERTAFSNCKQLERVVFHGNTKPDKDAFLNCSQMTVYAPKGSNAIKFAKKNSILYVEV